MEAEIVEQAATTGTVVAVTSVDPVTENQAALATPSAVTVSAGAPIQKTVTEIGKMMASKNVKSRILNRKRRKQPLTIINI
jgi:hypothetical protein